MTDKVAAFLRAVNDLSSATPYGRGWLVRTPLSYSDGDSVTVLVEPLSDGFRVSDRGEAIDRLQMWGASPDAPRVAEAIAAARAAAPLSPLGSESDEVATFGQEEALGMMILEVAQASLRVEQLRWLAFDRPLVKYDDRVASRLQSLAARHDWVFKRRAELEFPGGRTRRVTASITGNRGQAYVQAVSDADRERAVASCYYLFDRALPPRKSKIAALAGAESDWPKGLREDLDTVAVTAFFDDPGALERELERVTGGPLGASV